MKKITTSKAANEAAKKVADFIKSGWKKEVEDTEILVYWEEGRYTINVRAYFKKGQEIDNRSDYQIMKAMQDAGILECEAVNLLEDDNFRTYCGYSNWCDEEPKTTLPEVRKDIKKIALPADITATVATKNEPFPILYLQSNAKTLPLAVTSIMDAVKILRTMLKDKAKLTECWHRSTACLPKVQQTCTYAYKITLV